MNYILLTFISIFCFQVSSAQESSLKLNDSAMGIYKSNPDKALTILEKALKISEVKKDHNLIAKSKNNIGIVYRDLGRFEDAKALSLEALNAKDSMILASAHNNIGVINRNLGLYNEALENYLISLRIYEAKHMEKEIATTHNSIGLVYSYNGINDKAIEYHLKAKDVFEKLGNKKGISEVYNNIAIIYANDGQLDEALNYFKYSLEIEKALNDKKGIAESVNNVGAVYYYMGEIDTALSYFNQSVEIEKSIGNFAGAGSSYNNIAQTLVENGRVDEAKQYIDSAYHYAQKSKTVFDIESALLTYTDYYERKGNNKLALQFYKDYNKLHDSIMNFDTKSKIAELEIQYQTEKKEKEILSQRADLAEKELDLNKKNTQLLGLGVFALVLALLGYLFYNQQKLKNKQLQKENELKDALVKIETQSRLQDQRLRISRDLHDNIGAQLTFIISSLDNLKYGFKLPEKLDTKLQTISEFTSATIYELRDTIWAMNKSEITLEDLQSRISNFIDKADIASDDVDFKFNTMNSEVKYIKLTSVEGMNIYRIIQESINNALKYAEAKHIVVDFSAEMKALVFKVTDDGKGFDIENATLGNGINNMKKRAQDIGADIEIVSEVEKGTTIILNTRTA
nr:sensor histidine kinase [uncultured Psychroserpens sp.]